VVTVLPVAVGRKCFFQATRSKSYCMNASALAAGTCLGAGVNITSCALSQSTPARRAAVHCTIDPSANSVCFPIRKLGLIYGKQGHRVIEVNLQGGRGSTATVEVEVWAKAVGKVTPGCVGV
jgi:hypothetical protein